MPGLRSREQRRQRPRASIRSGCLHRHDVEPCPALRTTDLDRVVVDNRGRVHGRNLWWPRMWSSPGRTARSISTRCGVPDVSQEPC
jgi:hypothetical protein